MRFARYFGTSAEFRMNLQARYELDSAAREKKSDIEGVVRSLAAAH